MPSFSYKAKARTGEIVSGTLEADSRGAANARLQAMGYFPIDIRGGDGGGAAAATLAATAPRVPVFGAKPASRTATKPKAGSRTAARKQPARPVSGAAPPSLGSIFKSRGPRVRNTDLSGFYRQMSDLIGAGVPLVKAIGIIRNQTTNPTLTAILGQVNADVQGGETFATALEKHGSVFNKLNVALVRAGEAGGLLDQTLSRIADYAESQDELRAKVKSALAYPMIMVFVGASAVAVLLTYVMPKVLVIFKDLNQTLPAMTQFLITLSTFLQHYWYLLAVGGGIVWFLFKRYTATDTGCRRYHLFLLKLPKFGDLLLKREIAGFTRTLGSLLRNGVPILNALSISAEVMTIRPIREQIEKIPESITQGQGMAPSLRASPLFPSVVVNMVAIGEETGHLPDVLLRVAQSYETQVERDIKTLTSFIEPVIILVLGLVVGFIVISMLLPIFSLDPTAGS